MAESEIAVEKMAYYTPVTVTGVDDEGRTTVICPQCSAGGHIEPDGRVVCSMWQPVQDLLAVEYERLVAVIDG